jgi:WhiB family redox-sensing transcriptional regulator
MEAPGPSLPVTARRGPQDRIDETPHQEGVLLVTGAKRFDLLITDSEDWKTRGACVGADPDLWFPETTKRRRVPTSRGPQVSAAKAICATCPVRVTCLDHALSRPEPLGIWGGKSADERWAILDRRERA